MHENVFKDAISKYLDSMPHRSKVAFPDMIHTVCERLVYPFKRSPLSKWAHDVVYSRADLAVYRGRGIVKVKS